MTSPTGDSESPTFDVLPLSSEVRRAIDDMGYVHPTPVQRAVFEPARRGRDLVVQARTGTGKTAAFGLPLVDGLVREGEAAAQALVLCPTRELALQVTRELSSLSRHKGTSVVPVYGGAPMPKQVAELAAGAQIVVGTPGRVLDHLERGTLDPSSLRALVLDESDEMLSMGFLPQINGILAHLPKGHQTLLFSATVPPDIQRMAETRLKDPEFVTLSGDHIGALEIDHFVYMTFGDKIADLLQILEIEDPESAIIFCNTRDETKRVAGALSERGFSADWLNSDLPQSDREKVMAATRGGNLRFLVATDVAARGIDISHLTHVINHDFPETAEAYVHRTGRTGRAGRTGTAISLVKPSNIGNLYYLRLTYRVKPIEKQLPTALERKTRADADLVQTFAERYAARQPHPEDLALAQRLLSHEQAAEIVAGMLREHLGERADAREQASHARRARRPSVQNREARPPRGFRPEPRRSEARSEIRFEVSDPEPQPSEARSEGRAEAREPREPREPALGDEAPHTTPAATDGPEARRLRRRRRDEAPAAEGSAPDAASIEPVRGDIAEVYVNVGRRDGAEPDDFRKALGPLPSGDADVSVRHRHSFVRVPRDVLDQAIDALNGATIAGKLAMAEEARPRS